MSRLHTCKLASAEAEAVQRPYSTEASGLTVSQHPLITTICRLTSLNGIWQDKTSVYYNYGSQEAGHIR